MTPKEKAIGIRDKYIFTIFQVNEDYEDVKRKLLIHAKQCALIAVDEVLKSQNNIYGVNNRATTFYLKVKHELEKL